MPDLPPGAESYNYLAGQRPAAPAPRATPVPTPVPTPTPAIVPNQNVDRSISFEERMRRNQLPTPVPTASPVAMATPHDWLNHVISIFHPGPQQEHSLAAVDRLVNQADQLEHQLTGIQNG